MVHSLTIWYLFWRYQYIAWLMEIIGICSIIIWLDFIMYFLALFGIFTCCMYSFSSIIYVRECLEQFLYFRLGKCNRWFLIQIFLSHAAEKIISSLDLINARTSVTGKDDEKKHGCMCVLNQNFITNDTTLKREWTFLLVAVESQTIDLPNSSYSTKRSNSCYRWKNSFSF